MKHRNLPGLCFVWCLLGASLAANGQQQPAAPADKPDSKAQPTTTLSLDARLVNLPVIVRDKKGALVQTLTKDRLFADG